jgi:predicted transcriptional regulator
LSIITFSKVRTDIILKLEDGQKELSDLRSSLELTSPEIIPHIKKLLNKNIINKVDNRYYLTNIGFALIKKYRQLIKIIDIIEENEAFWNNHDIGLIPQNFFERVNELGQCITIKNKNVNINEAHEQTLKNVMESKSIVGVISSFHSDYITILLKKASESTPINIIFTEDVFNYVNLNYKIKLNNLYAYNTVRFFIVNENIKYNFVVTNKFISLSLPFNNGIFDNSECILSFDKSAINWGTDLFNFYKDFSQEFILY